MFTRFKKWLEASRERKRERAERDYGGLSKQEREDVRSRNPGFVPDHDSRADPAFDETKRGR